MTTSGNGWSASPSLKRRDFVVNGVPFVGGIRDDDNVEYVFRYFAEQYAERVEPLKDPGCWGFFYKPNANNPNVLSNHASATALDFNAPRHPNGVAIAKTFSNQQISEIHQILAECHGALRWGGDYTHTVDAMHVEINVSPAVLATKVAQMKKDQKKRRPGPVRKAIKAVKAAMTGAGPVQKKHLKDAKDDLKEINPR